MTTSRKIVYCIHSLHVAGGMERMLVVKANWLTRHGYEVTIVQTDGVGQKPFYEIDPKVKLIQLGLEYRYIPHDSAWKWLLRYLKRTREYKRKLTEVLMDIRPDITVSLLLGEVNFLTDIPDGSIKIAEAHVDKEHYRQQIFQKKNAVTRIIRGLMMKQLTRRMNRFDQVVLLTHEDEQNWKELKNVAVIPDPLPFWSNKVSDISTRKVIGVGRYVYQKGFDLLIRAWIIVHHNYPEWELHIYGRKNQHMQELQQLIEMAELKGTCFLHDAVQEIQEKYRESSLFVLSSRWEGFGMVLIEAMNCGLPVVSFDCPCGPKDIITHGRNGYLVENGNVIELGKQICRAIDDRENLKRLGIQARKDSEKYQMDAVMAQWIHLFDKLLKKST